MPRKSAGGTGVYVELAAELLAGMKKLADDNGRSFRDEMQSAVRRHLAAPPVVVETAPPLPGEEIPKGQTPKKGRPRKRPES